jgi:MSHA biogenesis protein MshO
MMDKRRLQGFTLVEMIVVIVITGIIGGIVAIFLRAPVQGYVDSARRAEMTDIADTALRRISRDLRLALPNSVRVTTSGSSTFLEFIPTIGGGRYRDSTDSLGAGNILDFSVPDTSFDVLGPMPPGVAGDQIVVYNLGISGADAYAGNTLATHNRRAVSGVAGNVISITSTAALPFDSCQYDASGYVVGGCRFQVVQNPVTYVCNPTAGTLTRWQETSFVATPQPTAVPAGQPVLATNVSACTFTYDAYVVAQSAGLVTMHLTITEQGESVSLYSATHVSNVP